MWPLLDNKPLNSLSAPICTMLCPGLVHKQLRKPHTPRGQQGDGITPCCPPEDLHYPQRRGFVYSPVQPHHRSLRPPSHCREKLQLHFQPASNCENLLSCICCAAGKSMTRGATHRSVLSVGNEESRNRGPCTPAGHCPCNHSTIQ